MVCTFGCNAVRVCVFVCVYDGILKFIILGIVKPSFIRASTVYQRFWHNDLIFIAGKPWNGYYLAYLFFFYFMQSERKCGGIQFRMPIYRYFPSPQNFLQLLHRAFIHGWCWKYESNYLNYKDKPILCVSAVTEPCSQHKEPGWDAAGIILAPSLLHPNWIIHCSFICANLPTYKLTRTIKSHNSAFALGLKVFLMAFDCL